LVNVRVNVSVLPSGGGPKIPECDTPPVNFPPDFTPVGRRALGSAGLWKGGWKLTVWGIHSLVVFQVTVWPALIETVSELNLLTAMSLLLHPATTFSPLAAVSRLGGTSVAAIFFNSPSSLSAVAAASAGDCRSASLPTTVTRCDMLGWRRQVTEYEPVAMPAASFTEVVFGPASAGRAVGRITPEFQKPRPVNSGAPVAGGGQVMSGLT